MWGQPVYMGSDYYFNFGDSRKKIKLCSKHLTFSFFPASVENKQQQLLYRKGFSVSKH